MKLSIFPALANTKVCRFEEYRGREDTITMLNCIGKNIVDIDMNRVCDFVKLDTLCIKNTSITKIPPGLDKLPNLAMLIVTNNLLINDYSNLAQLSLNINFKELVLCNNTLTEIPNSLRKLKYLNSLNLSHNQITEIPDWINEFNLLAKLYMRNNNLIKIPKTLFECKELDSIILSDNHIDQFPKDISNLPKLKEFCLERNKLGKVPLSLCSLSSLQKLDLSNNSITNIPNDIVKLQNLKTLILQNNKITVFPDALTVMYALRDLDLSQNHIFSLPLNLANIKTLKKLDLSFNSFESVPEVITLLPSLNMCKFSNNNIRLFDSFLLECKSNMQLNLSNNQICYLPVEIQNYTQLKFKNLDLRNNCIVDDNIYNGLGLKSIPSCLLSNIKLKVQRQVVMQEVFDLMNTHSSFWNIGKLSQCKIFDEIERTNKMSDKQMRKVYRHILRYFVDDDYKRDDYESLSSDDSEEETELDVQIKAIEKTEIISILRKNYMLSVYNLATISLERQANNNNSLRRKIAFYLRSISKEPKESINDSNINIRLKKYIKNIFVELLKRFQDAPTQENFDALTAAFTNLCSNHLIECITGQIEGLSYYQNTICYNRDQSNNNEIESFISQRLAHIKENIFLQILLKNNHVQNVHLISFYRAKFEKLLGINCHLEDPYDVFNMSKLEIMSGDKLLHFFNIFSINRVSLIILEDINRDHKMISAAHDFIKRYIDEQTKLKFEEKINRISHRDSLGRAKSKRAKFEIKDNEEIAEIDEYYKNFNLVTRLYFEYNEIDGYDALEYKALKREGLTYIMKKMNLIIQKNNSNNIEVK